MLDLTIFQNRLFSAATAAAFINGLSRFSLLFVFVFYFQGVKGDDPIVAGIKLAPMALGMLVASPIAGDLRRPPRLARARRRGGWSSPALALAAMTTLGKDTPYWQPALWLAHRRHRLGHVQLAEHRGDDGHRPAAPPRHRRRRADDAAEHRRRALDRLRAGDRHRGGARRRCCSRSSPGSPAGLSDATLAPFIHNMHVALWVLAATSLVGAGVSMLRPKHVSPSTA